MLEFMDVDIRFVQIYSAIILINKQKNRKYFPYKHYVPKSLTGINLNNSFRGKHEAVDQEMDF